MALNISPVLQNISAFDAEFGRSDKGKSDVAAPIFKFSWTEGIVQKNELVIHDGNNIKVYEHTIQSMDLEHQLNRDGFVNGGLVNGKKYFAKIRVYIYVGKETLEVSSYSQEILFYCYNTPYFYFTNFSTPDLNADGIAIVNSNSLDISVCYEQSNGESLSRYHFELEKLDKINDKSGTKVFISDEKYAATTTAINESGAAVAYLKYAIGGMEETISEYIPYKIICTGETIHGMIIYTEQIFIVKPMSSGVGSLLSAINVGDGSVQLISNYIVLAAKYSGEDAGIDPTYLTDENNNPYAIDLTNNDYIEFTESINILEPYEFVVKGEFNLGTLITFKNSNGDTGILSLNKINYTTETYYNFVFTINRGALQYQIQSSYFESEEPIAGMVDISCTQYITENDIYCLYNINAKVGENVIEFNLNNLNEKPDNDINTPEEDIFQYYVTTQLSSLPLNQTYIKTNSEGNKEQISINYIKIENGIYDDFYVSKTNLENKDTFTISDKWTEYTYLHAKFNGTLMAGNTDFDAKYTTNLIIKRREYGTYKWFPLKNIKVTSIESYNFTEIDMYAASGTTYEYAVVPIVNNEEGIYSTATCEVQFYNLVIIDKDNTYMTPFDIAYTQQKNNTSSTILPINSKYPIYVSNATNDYFTGNISATFLEMSIKKNEKTGFVEYDYGHPTRYRDEVLSFLNNRKIKFIKEPFGKCWLAAVGETISDEDSGHPNAHLISFDFTEVGNTESNEDMYRFGMLDIGQEWWM